MQNSKLLAFLFLEIRRHKVTLLQKETGRGDPISILAIYFELTENHISCLKTFFIVYSLRFDAVAASP